MGENRDSFNAAEHYGEVEKALDRLDPGWAKAALFFRSDCTSHFGHGADEMRVRGLLAIHQELEVRRARYEAGDTLSLLQAVAVCADENLPLPTWLAVAYKKALRRFVSVDGDATSLDEVFRSEVLPTGTPKRAAKAKQDWLLGGEMWRLAWKLALADESLTSFDAVMKKVLECGNYGVKLSTAKKLVNRADKNQWEHLGEPQKALSRFLKKRQKGVT